MTWYTVFMPSRNTIKLDVPNSFYHVYARGHSRQEVYKDDVDYRVFLNLFKRYLSEEEMSDQYGKPYRHLRNRIELLCYCLMPTHFHLLIYQVEQGSMEQLMRGVMTAYSRYSNTKYGTSGALFESRYKASRISNDQYLLHISRYIHLNPPKWEEYPYSSLQFMSSHHPDWVQPARIEDLFSSREKYLGFLSDYESYKSSLDTIKSELANAI